MGMAKNVLFDSCKFNADVVDALIRQPHTNATLPFVQNNIPGLMYATDYDLGRWNYAYKDNDYQNTEREWRSCMEQRLVVSKRRR